MATQSLRDYVPSTTAGKTWSLSVGKSFARENYFYAIEGKLETVGDDEGTLEVFHTIPIAGANRVIHEILTIARLTDKAKASVMAEYKALMRERGFIA